MRRKTPLWAVIALASALAGGFWLLTAQSPLPTPAQMAVPAQATASAQPANPAAKREPRWQGTQLRGLSGRAEMYYEGAWGVGEFHVKVAESGELIRFNYRVFDPRKSAVL